VAPVLFVALFGALLATEGYLLFFRASGTPSVAMGDRPRLAGEIAGATTVVQTFGIEAGGLSAITLAAKPFQTAVSGDVTFELGELPRPSSPSVPPRPDPSAKPVLTLKRAARDVVQSATFTLSFDPLEDSKGKHYQIRISAPDTPAGQGIGVWATWDQAYTGGVLAVAGKEQWSDLVFSVRAVRATLFARVQYMLRDKPLGLGSPWTLVILLVLYNWALGTFAWYMLFAPDDERTNRPARVTNPQPVSVADP
jgi:hypothetical protein